MLRFHAYSCALFSSEKTNQLSKSECGKDAMCTIPEFIYSKDINLDINKDINKDTISMF